MEVGPWGGEVPRLSVVQKSYPSHAIPGRWGEVKNAFLIVLIFLTVLFV